MKLELEITKVRVEECINQGKQRYTEIQTKSTIESKKCTVFYFYRNLFIIVHPNNQYVIFHTFLASALKRQLDCSQGLLKELLKYEKEQEITFNVCNQKKSEAKQYKKKLLNDQQKQVIFTLSVT